MKFVGTLLMIMCVFFTGSLFAKINNFHEIETDSNGFGIYRYGQPSRDDVREMCRIGIEEVMVLSGNAADHEFKYQDECPSLKVIYNSKQNATVPLSTEFLKTFDQWVEDAKASGKKIAFRCVCGCHRTGRLAAYYQMKFQNLGADDAIVLMNKWGKYMFLHPELKPQVRDLYNFIHGQPCTQKSKYCVIRD